MGGGDVPFVGPRLYTVRPCALTVSFFFLSLSPHPPPLIAFSLPRSGPLRPLLSPLLASLPGSALVIEGKTLSNHDPHLPVLLPPPATLSFRNSLSLSLCLSLSLHPRTHTHTEPKQVAALGRYLSHSLQQNPTHAFFFLFFLFSFLFLCRVPLYLFISTPPICSRSLFTSRPAYL